MNINGDNIVVIGRDVIYNGKKLPPVPTESRNSHVTTIDNHIYVNGFEWKNDRWERTLKAIWYYLFK